MENTMDKMNKQIPTITKGSQVINAICHLATIVYFCYALYNDFCRFL